MIAIDNKQLSIETCLFRLQIHSIDFSVHPQQLLYVQWKPQKIPKKAEMQKLNRDDNGQLASTKPLLLNLDLAFGKDTNQCKPYSSSLALHVSDKNKQGSLQNKGSIQIRLHEVINNNRFSKRQPFFFKSGPLQTKIQFTCVCFKRFLSNLERLNINSIYNDAQLWFTPQTYLKNQLQEIGRNQNQDSISSVQKNPKLHQSDNDKTFSIKQFINKTQICYQKQFNSRDDKTFLSEPYLLMYDQKRIDSVQHLQQLQAKSTQELIKQIQRLQKSIYLTRFQRKIQKQHQQQQLKKVLRQVSMKQAQLMKSKDDSQCANMAAAQALDRCVSLQQQLDSVSQRLKVQIAANQQFQQTYQILTKIVEAFKEQDKQRQNGKQELQRQRQIVQNLIKNQKNYQIREKQLIQENNKLRMQFQKISNTQVQISRKLQQLETQLQQKSQKSDLTHSYSQKLCLLQQKIDDLQQIQFVHRSTYNSSSSYKTKNNILIEDRCDVSLKQIIQQQLQQSLQSIEDSYKDQREIKTSTSISAISNELQLMKLLCRNIQKDYDHLKKLYNQQQIMLQERAEKCQGLVKDIQRLRFQFLCQLSRVTALVNQKIIQNRKLQEDYIESNNKLQKSNKKLQSCACQNQSTLNGRQITNQHYVQISASDLKSYQNLLSQKSFLMTRCCHLQQENSLLMKVNEERQILLNQVIALLNKRLNKAQIQVTDCSSQTFSETMNQNKNLSDLIYQFPRQKALQESEQESSSPRHSITLLIDSTKKDNQQLQALVQIQALAPVPQQVQSAIFLKTSSSYRQGELQSRIEQLSNLIEERNWGVQLLSQSKLETSQYNQENKDFRVKKVQKDLQNLKKSILNLEPKQSIIVLLSATKQLETDLTELIQN